MSMYSSGGKAEPIDQRDQLGRFALYFKNLVRLKSHNVVNKNYLYNLVTQMTVGCLPATSFGYLL
jgi:hypothetical protein